MVNPKCVVCGVEVAVEGYEELAGVWKELIDRTAYCPQHVEASEVVGLEELRQKKRETYRSALAASRLPSAARGLGWDDLDPEEPEDVVDGAGNLIASQEQATATRTSAIDSAKRWAAGDLTGLVLGGPVGVGKSRIAAVAAQAFLYRRVAALRTTSVRPMVPFSWVMVPTLIQMSRGEYESDRRREAEKVLTGTNALVLDDIDKVKPTEFALDLLLEAIESRTSRDRPLLVTTNLRYPELKDLVGDPIASRLGGYCKGHRIIGEDRRTS